MEWTLDEKNRLIEAVAGYLGDWEQISKVVFEGIYTPEECALQFLSLPINETLLLRFQTAEARRAAGAAADNTVMQTYVPTVFQDTSNPLLSQLAIFAKSLDYMEHHPEGLRQNLHQSIEKPEEDQIMNANGNLNKEQSNNMPERRSTRKHKKEVLNLKHQEGDVSKPQEPRSHSNDLYLIPQTRTHALLPKETMLAIVDKTRESSRRLAKSKRKEIERELDNAIYNQMRKLEHKAQFLRQFWQSFELERRDIYLAREEILAERVALSVLRSGELKGTQAEKILSGNEFSTLTSTMRLISGSAEKPQ